MSPLWVSLRVVALAMVLVVPLGVGLGWVLARKRFAGIAALDAAVLLPLVLPPSVVGYVLLLVFGRNGPVGSVLESWFGIRLVFSFLGAALAAAVVALPLMAKGAEAAFGGVDRRLEEVAAAHGMNPLRTFLAVSLPLSLGGLLIALTLATLRALGEFGATLTFAGYLPGETNTAPLEVYMALEAGDGHTAARLVVALATVSWAAAIALAVFSRRREAT